LKKESNTFDMQELPGGWLLRGSGFLGRGLAGHDIYWPQEEKQVREKLAREKRQEKRQKLKDRVRGEKEKASAETAALLKSEQEELVCKKLQRNLLENEATTPEMRGPDFLTQLLDNQITNDNLAGSTPPRFQTPGSRALAEIQAAAQRPSHAENCSGDQSRDDIGSAVAGWEGDGFVPVTRKSGGRRKASPAEAPNSEGGVNILKPQNTVGLGHGEGGEASTAEPPRRPPLSPSRES
jgi:hypothetical protein